MLGRRGTPKRSLFTIINYRIKHLAEYVERGRAWRKAHPTYGRDKRIAIRKEVIKHYGGSCACCGQDVFEFLAIDHINGEGCKQKRELGMSGFSFILWLKRSKYPEGFQVLCHNCNSALGYYGCCPHRPEIVRPVSPGRKKIAA